MWLFITTGVLVVSGVGTYFYLQKNDNFDINADFKEIKSALRRFRNENVGLTKGIENLEPYMHMGSNVKLDRYLISIDDKFLVVKKIPVGVDPVQIARQIGGQSKYSNNKLKLSFFTLSSSPDPVAVIRVKPMSNITTTTRLEYSYDESIVDDKKVVKAEWEDNEEYFDSEGVHTVRLKVMDKHFRWSEWETMDIFVSEAKGVKSIHGAGGHIQVVYNNGNIDAFGDNSFGQLGNCTNQNNIKVEPLVQVQRVDSAACGDYHTLFLKSDKRVFATGKNDFGQLGIGNRNNSKIPKLTWGIENISQVVAGNGFSAAVTTDGFVYTWGENEANCLGQGEAHFIDRPSKVEGIESIQSIALGRNNILALSYDGTVVSWGENNFGELALGYKSKFNEPTVSVLKGIKELACGNGFSLALTLSGKVMAMGSNKVSQCGIDGEQIILFPIEIHGLKSITKIVARGDHSIALDETGNVYAWGQFSPVDEDYAIKPYKADELSYVKDIAATNNFGYALMEDGTIYEFGSKFHHLVKLEHAEKKESDEN